MVAFRQTKRADHACRRSQRWRSQRYGFAAAAFAAGPQCAISLRKSSVVSSDVIGFTSTFQQNTAALAAAREVKRLSPHVVTVFGGANCDGEQGLALHRNFPFVDFVVRGEGDVAFPAFLKRAVGDRDYAAIAGLCWRQSDGSTAVNAMPRSPLPPSAMMAPVPSGTQARASPATSVRCAADRPPNPAPNRRKLALSNRSGQRLHPTDCTPTTGHLNHEPQSHQPKGHGETRSQHRVLQGTQPTDPTQTLVIPK